MSGRPFDQVIGLVQIAIRIGHCRALTMLLAVIVFVIIRLIAGTV